MFDIQVLQKGAREKRLFIDVVAYPFITDLENVLKIAPVESFGRYDGRLKLGGVKITLDGSPQGRTAYFTTPYLTGGPGGEENWCGQPLFEEAQVLEWFRWVHGHDLQLIVHCNGDAAIDMFLRCHEASLGDAKSGDHRSTVIHSQFMRPEHLGMYRDLNLIASFYTEHTYFFARTHLANRGIEQTRWLSPIKSAQAMGIRCTNHTDFNVAPIDQLFVMWTAVNRISREGDLIGPDERVAPIDALRAHTIDAAYMYREEDRKGSLEVGKLADLVILDGNPLTVEPLTIKDIRVLETIKEGKTIYRAN